MILGLVLARGGSKRVPRKNIRLLGGAPLIAWTLSAARQTHSLDRIMVSSEDDEILDIVHGFGFEALRRPAELAGDEVSSYPAILHALDSLDMPAEWVCLLQPTSPFRIAMDIDACVGLATRILSDLPAVVSVMRGADVPNGAVYVSRADWLREKLAIGETHPFDNPMITRYIMPPERSLDIDTPEDFAKAERMIEKWVA